MMKKLLLLLVLRHGISQFNYVPLAKYADKAGNIFSGYFNDLDNVPSGLSNGGDDIQLAESTSR